MSESLNGTGPNERQEKASRPSPPAAPVEDGIAWTEAFSLHFCIGTNPPRLTVRWNISDAAAQQVFFDQNPLAAAMLAALSQGPAQPPQRHAEDAAKSPPG